ncbi:MAG: DUF1543 domain-containing protein [Chitinophagaceae bacterium]
MPKLFMLLIGATPQGRNIEQHDIFFGIGETIKEIIPGILSFWTEAKGKLHIDAWREVKRVNGYTVNVVANDGNQQSNAAQLFFINLGGYKQNEFEEFHYKMIIAAADKGGAVTMAKQTAFFRHTGFKGATSHIDDKYGVDVDDIYEIIDILPADTKKQYKILITAAADELPEDEIHLGYFKLDKFE